MNEGTKVIAIRNITADENVPCGSEGTVYRFAREGSEITEDAARLVARYYVRFDGIGLVEASAADLAAA